jgi:DNA primase
LAANGSTRAGAGAPISMPVTWEALARTTAGSQFTILNSKKYLKTDPWAEIGKVKQKLPR